MLSYTKSIAYDHQLRFFRREGTVWPPYVHTFPTVQGRTEKIPGSEKNVRFVHPADETIADLECKTNTYTDGEQQKRGDQTIWGGSSFGASSVAFFPQLFPEAWFS